MSTGITIRHLSRRQVDDAKWDACVGRASNGLIYAYSFYLDAMARHWDALVWNDYEAVMPLTWNRKYGFYYLYQPPFTPSLGVFGSHLTADLLQAFIDAIPSRFRLVEIKLNPGHLLTPPATGDLLHNNYILSLKASYSELRKAYRENHKRNIQRALRTGCLAEQGTELEAIIALNRELMQQADPLPEEAYHRFRKLYSLLSAKGQAETYGVRNAAGKLLASCVFFYSHERAYYILAGNHPDGKTIGASHLLLDFFIQEKAGQQLLLDFEGSDIKSLAFFYEGFGASRELYPALHINRLPFYLRWWKR